MKKTNMLRHYLTEDEMNHAEQNGFGANGLRYSWEELNAVDPSQETMERMAAYVDAVTFAKVFSNDTAFLRPMLEPPRQTVNISVTGLGNVAYVAVYCSDPECRKRAEALYHLLVTTSRKN